MKVNPVLKRTIVMLEKQGRKRKRAIWKAASKTLSSGSSTRTAVNVGHLSRVARGESPIFIPGKVLGSGAIDKKLVVGAYAFSSAARRKIESAGGEVVDAQEFLKRYPEGSGVILVG